MSVSPCIRTDGLDHTDAPEHRGPDVDRAADGIAELRTAHADLLARITRLRERRTALDSALGAATERCARAACWQVAVRRQARTSASSVQADLAVVNVELDDLATRAGLLGERIRRITGGVG